MFLIGWIVCIIFGAVNGDIVVKIPGDFVIGVLFRLRRAFDPLDESLKCEKIREVYGIQRLEAALWALELINNNENILPGVTLGMQVHDICKSETAALAESLDMVQGGITDEAECLRSTFCPTHSNMIGVIGPDTSKRTILVQNFLKLFRIPQIGYSANAPELSDKHRYSSYLRIRPSDTGRSEVIRDILKKFNWTYIAMITSEELENVRLRKSFWKLVEPDCGSCRICISNDFIVGPHHRELTLDQILYKVNAVQSVSVVICFCNSEVLRRLFETVKELNLTHRFTFIVSDHWEDFNVLTKGLEEEAWGTISVNVETKSIEQFSAHYKSLKPSINTRNPIFNEFWEQKFNCALPIQSSKPKQIDVSRTIDSASMTTPKKSCTGNESLAENYQENRKIGFVMKAVGAMAFGLHNMMKQFCGDDYHGVCRDMYPFDPSILLTHLRNVSFDFNNERVTIDDEISVAKYDIVNFQQLPNDTFAFLNIGKWKNGNVQFHRKFQGRKKQNVTSICSQPCPLGYREVFSDIVREPSCCWQCAPCGHYDYVSKDKKRCIECTIGEKPNVYRTGCDVIPVSEHGWTDPLAIMIMTFSVIGFIGTFYTLYIFIKYRNTPVVKASSRELCYVILFGMLLAHSTIFIVLAPRSSVQCAVLWIIPEMSCAAMFAGLFIKTYRISKILVLKKNEFPSKKLRVMSTSAQVAMTFVCIGCMFVISCAMLIISPPEVTVNFWTRDKPIHACSFRPWAAIPPIALVGVLQSLCIIYGIKTRNVPGKFNESKFIGFAMLISLIIVAFMVIMYRTMSSWSHILAGGMNFDALAIHVFLFVPKLYIIVVRPEKNVRNRFATTRGIRTHVGVRVNENTVETFMESPLEHSSYDGHRTAENHCRLRMTVGVQTDSDGLQNISSIGQDNGAFLDDDEVYHQHSYE